ncbi:MAG: polysaccharide deacetylase family protein [Acidobacteria bacterium]|nr:polysaccharide deacetylase family protein [Acidobacteriota bacterium]
MQKQLLTSSGASRRAVAVTFDDLPLLHEPIEGTSLRQIYEQLLQAITAYGVPAVGFVNEKLVYKNCETDSRIEILRMWLKARLELGNHTFSHLYFYETPLQLFQADVIRGEAITSALLREHGTQLRYFRHPFLCTGPDLPTKTAFEDFLAARNYQIAPVTVDSVEWMFAELYADALRRKDARAIRRIAKLYVPYMSEVFEFFEKLSMDVLGYEVRQILMLHATQLNAHLFAELAHMIKGRGYEFITLERALEDEAYKLPDTYVGPVGISWLQRWALAKGLEFRKEPAPPPYIKRFDNPKESGTEYKWV